MSTLVVTKKKNLLQNEVKIHTYIDAKNAQIIWYYKKHIDLNRFSARWLASHDFELQKKGLQISMFCFCFSKKYYCFHLMNFVLLMRLFHHYDIMGIASLVWIAFMNLRNFRPDKKSIKVIHLHQNVPAKLLPGLENLCDEPGKCAEVINLCPAVC